ncbi:hypothetical protein HMPREF9446_01421 [Bacteroides fluxus YIT 12057]|uniref:Uncharacterized protein n=1 Tax=Bacteroides fluxus YIT 12057 TaxID=763034 RepID=F3PRR9_9BACE|nr:hypothetical protein HMPREF9446_01421 [Bacteroides fluxus YIT 12057]
MFYSIYRYKDEELKECPTKFYENRYICHQEHKWYNIYNKV